jgi:hypothetical protein
MEVTKASWQERRHPSRFADQKRDLKSATSSLRGEVFLSPEETGDCPLQHRRPADLDPGESRTKVASFHDFFLRDSLDFPRQTKGV